jgi:hypothetical protein
VLSFVVIVIVVTIHNKMANSIELNSTQNVDHDIAIIVVIVHNKMVSSIKLN